MTRAPLLLAALLAACAGRDPGRDDAETDVPAESDPPAADDTGADDTALDETGLDDTDAVEPDDTGSPPSCATRVVETLPAAGATGVFSFPDLRVTFSRDEHATASFTLSDRRGTVAVGAPSWSTDGRTATFRPDAPLATSSLHTLSIAHRCGLDTVDFTTGTVGAPVDAADFLGRTYVADLRGGRVVEPVALAPVFTALLQGATLQLALLPVSTDGTDLSLVAGWLDARFKQDPCTPTLQGLVADYAADPFFALDAPDGLHVPILGADLFLDDLVFTGAFSPAGDRMEGLRLAGVIDMRDVAPLLGVGDANAVCLLVSALSGSAASCGGCPDGERFCLDAVVGGVTASQAGGVDLDVVTPEDVAANPFCP